MSKEGQFSFNTIRLFYYFPCMHVEIFLNFCFMCFYLRNANETRNDGNGREQNRIISEIPLFSCVEWFSGKILRPQNSGVLCINITLIDTEYHLTFNARCVPWSTHQQAFAKNKYRLHFASFCKGKFCHRQRKQRFVYEHDA
jgi:hypothetical protein